jgi:hypothetical protein
MLAALCIAAVLVGRVAALTRDEAHFHVLRAAVRSRILCISFIGLTNWSSQTVAVHDHQALQLGLAACGDAWPKQERLVIGL